MASLLDRISVTRKIAGMLVLVLLASFLVHAALILPRFRKHSLEQGRQLLQENANGLARDINDLLERAGREAERVARLPEVVSMDRARIDPVLLFLDRTTPNFLHFSVQDPRGFIVARPDKPERVGEDRSGRDYTIGVGATGKTTFSDIFLSVSGNLSTDIAAPIRGEDGSLRGVLVCALGVEERNAGIFKEITGVSVGASGFAYLVDRKGDLVARGRQGGSGGAPFAPSLSGDLAQGREASGVFPIAGVPWLVAFSPVPVSGWGVVVQVPVSELPDYSASLFVSFLTILVVMLVLGSLASILLVRRLVAPLRALSREEGAAAGGKEDRGGTRS